MQKLSFQWNIKDFDHCDRVNSESLKSPVFSVLDPTYISHWILRLYPVGCSNEGTLRPFNNDLTLLLFRLDSGATYQTKYSISILNKNGRRLETVNSSKLWEIKRMTITEMIKMKNYTRFQYQKSIFKCLAHLGLFEIRGA